MRTYQIDVDEEVFDYLQRHAVPLVDTPNSILRRLLLKDRDSRPLASAALRGTASARGTQSPRHTSRAFMHEVLGREFKGERRKADVRKTRRLFEYERHLVYYLNFSKPDSHNLWYKITEPVADELLTSRKTAVVIFANAADRIYYKVPVSAIKKQLEKKGIERLHYPFAINIDRSRHLWRELDWDIGGYLHAE